MKLVVAVIVVFLSLPSISARACGHRLGIGAGLVHIDSTDSTNFEIGGEYECRMNPLMGVGAVFNHVFTESGITFLAAPNLYLHPLAGDFYVAAAPLFQLGGQGTHVGARLSTRMPLPLGLFVLVPSFAVDFINGGRLYWFGLGIAI